jgi:hypothetical protein
MLIWRLRIPRADDGSALHTEVVCHVQKRDAAYRLMMRSNGVLVVDERHESIFAAARRAEQLRQEVRPPAPLAGSRVPALL